MRVRNVQCPVCGTFLAVPPGCSDCFVRCGLCHHRFRLPKHITVTDEAIAEWLWEGREREEPDAKTKTPAAEDKKPAKLAMPQAGSSGETAVLPALTEMIRLVRVDGKGALLEFPASRLREEEFRCAMPRVCIRCGQRTHLQVHMIIYAAQLVDSYSLEAEHSAGNLKVAGPQLQHMDNPELLARLPEVPNVPKPANLPMPYWLCDMCTGTGMISGQIQVNPESGKGVCRLFIRSLRRAEAFLIKAGGQDTHDHAELRRRLTAMADNPWDNLPEVIQHRIGGWYNPNPDERFVVYVPDRDLTRSEDGMSGLLVTNLRFIYHTQLRHKESKGAEPLRLQLAMASNRGRLRIKSASWEVKRFTVDREGISRLRRALTMAKYNAVWY